MAKVTVVGAGFFGKMVAQRILQKDLADVVLTDIVEGLPQGLALDMMQSAPIEGFSSSIVGTNEYGPTEGSDVVVVTAGLPRKPGMSRADLIGKNSQIIESVVGQVAPNSPDAVLIVVTNPLDEMTHVAAAVSGLPKERVIGQAGMLDSARFRYFVAEAVGCLPHEVEGATLGSHGEIMVALPRLARAKGRPITELLSADEISAICERTRDGGAEIVGLLKTGSAYFAPSSGTVAMVQAVLQDTKETMPVCAWVTGQYGLSDIFLGVPAKLGAGGVVDIEEWDLLPDELEQLHAAAAIVRERVETLGVDL
ncbi:MAG TPA: malate dehydrogenase [Actinomycetota bacterium]|nr:malate dehydrogenase [Actinomycetota bacterium]